MNAITIRCEAGPAIVAFPVFRIIACSLAPRLQLRQLRLERRSGSEQCFQMRSRNRRSNIRSFSLVWEQSSGPRLLSLHGWNGFIVADVLIPYFTALPVHRTRNPRGQIDFAEPLPVGSQLLFTTEAHFLATGICRGSPPDASTNNCARVDTRGILSKNTIVAQPR